MFSEGLENHCFDPKKHANSSDSKLLGLNWCSIVILRAALILISCRRTSGESQKSGTPHPWVGTDDPRTTGILTTQSSDHLRTALRTLRYRGVVCRKDEATADPTTGQERDSQRQTRRTRRTCRQNSRLSGPRRATCLEDNTDGHSFSGLGPAISHGSSRGGQSTLCCTPPNHRQSASACGPDHAPDDPQRKRSWHTPTPKD